MRTDNITILPDASANSITGVFTHWYFGKRRSQVALDTLRTEWVERGLSEDLLPELPTEEEALNRAADYVAGRFTGSEGRVTVTVVRHRKPHMIQFVVTMKNHASGEDQDVRVDKSLKVHVGETGGLVMLGQDIAGIFPVLEGRYNRAKVELDSSSDLSGWLTNLVMFELGGIKVRFKGGTYMVLAPFKARWKRMVSALEAAMPTAEVSMMTAARDEDTLRSIIRAFAHEVREMVDEAEDTIAGNVRASTLTKKKNAAKAARDKVKLYEKALSVTLGDLHEALDGLNRTIVAAGAAAHAASVRG